MPFARLGFRCCNSPLLPGTNRSVIRRGAYRIATLSLRQMELNAPWMSASDIIQTIRMVVARRAAVEQRVMDTQVGRTMLGTVVES